MAFIAPIPLPKLQPSAKPAPTTHAAGPRQAQQPPTCKNAKTAPRPMQVRLKHLYKKLQEVEQLTRPGAMTDPDRYSQLPEHVKTPSQMLGKLSPGCEGTKGVFPKCNFGCQPCYHSEGANKVRVDGLHTVTEVARQMDTLHKVRGHVAHCQLIGGEVSLLPPEDHALALETMRFFGRIPMSFTHGDFDYDYLHRIAVLPSGRPRFSRIDFAVHFDMDMRGRRGIPKPASEADLKGHRQRFVQMFQRLQREHGVQYYIAHNMTVQTRNLPQLPTAVADLVGMGFRLLSFQPAALTGSRRVTNLRDVDDEDGEMVWRQIERGVGMRLSYNLFQMGDVRCNRMAICGVVGGGRRDGKKVHIFPMFDEECAEDKHLRDIIMKEFGNIVLAPHWLYLKLFRTLVKKPWLLLPGLQWVLRVIRRAKGVWPILRRGFHPLTIVMHRFMDAEDVQVAWDLMEDGVGLDDERVDRAGSRVRETIERLRSCSYAMAHPEEGRVVPACVQHAVYDPVENVALAETLPLSEAARPAADAHLPQALS